MPFLFSVDNPISRCFSDWHGDVCSYGLLQDKPLLPPVLRAKRDPMSNGRFGTFSLTGIAVQQDFTGQHPIGSEDRIPQLRLPDPHKLPQAKISPAFRLRLTSVTCLVVRCLNSSARRRYCDFCQACVRYLRFPADHISDQLVVVRLGGPEVMTCSPSLRMTILSVTS